MFYKYLADALLKSVFAYTQIKTEAHLAIYGVLSLPLVDRENLALSFVLNDVY